MRMPVARREGPIGRAWRQAGVVLMLLALAGCGTLPSLDLATRDARASKAIALSTTTTLGRIARESQPSPELSGFRLMPLGTFSLDTRVQLARRAEVSLDVQYYHFASDETGRWLMRALRDAALRGVRVRLLVDDLYTGGEDDFLLGIAALSERRGPPLQPVLLRARARPADALRGVAGRVRRASTTGCTTSSSLPTVRWR